MNNQEFENSIKELKQNIRILNCDNISCEDIVFEEFKSDTIKCELCKLPSPLNREGFDQLVLTFNTLDEEKHSHFFHSSTQHLDGQDKINSLEELYNFINAKLNEVKNQDGWYLFYSEKQTDQFLLFSITKSEDQLDVTSEEFIEKSESIWGVSPIDKNFGESEMNMSIIKSDDIVYMCFNTFCSIEDFKITQHQSPRILLSELKKIV